MAPQNEEDRRFKEQILHVFKFTVRFLQQHGLRYVACGGTVLGAVRHQDFIPWDDDIDIYMSRQDYERLLDLRDECRREGFDVVSLRDKGYYLPFAKVCDMHTTLWEEEQYPFPMGVYVDIFALDNFSCSDAELTAIQRRSLKHFYHYLPAVTHFSPRLLLQAVHQHQSETVRQQLLAIVCRPFRRLLLQRFLNYQRWYSSFDGEKTVCVTQWAGRIFKREWFEDVIELPFADTTVVVPRDYDGYLRCLYGDYMTPPPVEQRVTAHHHYYLNFDERKTLAEIKKLKSYPT